MSLACPRAQVESKPSDIVDGHSLTMSKSTPNLIDQSEIACAGITRRISVAGLCVVVRFVEEREVR